MATSKKLSFVLRLGSPELYRRLVFLSSQKYHESITGVSIKCLLQACLSLIIISSLFLKYSQHAYDGVAYQTVIGY